MDINRIIMAVFAIGALIGGVDYVIGNKYGFGDKFKEAITLMPATAFNMVGIICISPVIALILRVCIGPLLHVIGIDPGTLGGVLALDMGGYPLAMELAEDAKIGQYAGILIGSIFGCTLVFSIPVGMGLIKMEAHTDYIVGIIIGLIAMPAGLIAGGISMGIAIPKLIYQTLPVIFMSALLIAGLLKIRDAMVWFFYKLTKGLRFLIDVGLVVGAVVYLLGWETPYIIPITDAMNTVVNITLALLGSLPLAMLLQMILKKPLEMIGRKLHIQDTACVGMLVAMVSAIPVFTMLDDMDSRSRIVVSTFLIDGMAILGAHLAFAASNDAAMTGPLLVCKITASVVGLIIAFIYTGKREEAKT